MSTDIWTLDGIVVVPTNRRVKKDGTAVMGAGLALQAAQRYPELPKELGISLQFGGNNRVHYFPQFKVLAFPTKDHWADPSTLKQVTHSAKDMADWLWDLAQENHFVTLLVPRLGCGLGGLGWNDVKPVLEDLWKDVDPRHTIRFVDD